MLFFNHVAGGLTFTVTFCSFADVNVYEKPEYLALTLFSSVAPDIDYPKSVIGKVFLPLSKWIEKNHGHRTITHSLLACVIYTLVISLIQTLTGANNITLIAFTAYFSHLIFDMCTRSGIPFFYPLQNYRCVLPANPKLRLKTGDMRAEFMIFSCFIFLNMLSYDLAELGFWTTYNKAFATFSHVKREQLHDSSPIVLNLKNKHTGEVRRGSLVEITEDEAIILDSTSFFTVKNTEYDVIDFKHRGVKHQEKIIFESLSVDSVNKLLDTDVIEANLFCTNEVRYRDKNQIPKEGTIIKFTHRKEPKIYPVEKDNSKLELEKQLLEESINEELEKEKISIQERTKLVRELEKIKDNYSTLSAFEKGKAIRNIEELENKITAFESYKADTRLLQIKLNNLIQSKPQLTTISGFVTKISYNYDSSNN